MIKKSALVLSDFNEIWIFSTDFRGKNAQISNNMKIRPVEAELLHVDRQTDRQDEANNLFFVILRDAPKNCI